MNSLILKPLQSETISQTVISSCVFMMTCEPGLYAWPISFEMLKIAFAWACWCDGWVSPPCQNPESRLRLPGNFLRTPATAFGLFVSMAKQAEI